MVQITIPRIQACKTQRVTPPSRRPVTFHFRSKDDTDFFSRNGTSKTARWDAFALWRISSILEQEAVKSEQLNDNQVARIQHQLAQLSTYEQRNNDNDIKQQDRNHVEKRLIELSTKTKDIRIILAIFKNIYFQQRAVFLTGKDSDITQRIPILMMHTLETENPLKYLMELKQICNPQQTPFKKGSPQEEKMTFIGESFDSLDIGEQMQQENNAPTTRSVQFSHQTPRENHRCQYRFIASHTPSKNNPDPEISPKTQQIHTQIKWG